MQLGRAPWTTAGDLDEAQQQLKDEICASWGGGAVGLSPVDSDGRLVGPFDLMVASPQVGSAVLALAASFRDAELSVLERELVILTVAAVERSDFMWAGHLPVAVAAGLDPGAGERLKDGGSLELDDPLHTVHRVARALLEHGDLDQGSFETAVEKLGWQRVQEVVWLVGHYRTFALAMRVARIPVPEKEEG